jgi:hypothetical protein
VAGEAAVGFAAVRGNQIAVVAFFIPVPQAVAAVAGRIRRYDGLSVVGVGLRVFGNDVGPSIVTLGVADRMVGRRIV